MFWYVTIVVLLSVEHFTTDFTSLFVFTANSIAVCRLFMYIETTCCPIHLATEVTHELLLSLVTLDLMGGECIFCQKALATPTPKLLALICVLWTFKPTMSVPSLSVSELLSTVLAGKCTIIIYDLCV